MNRALELPVALLALASLTPLLAAIAVAIKLDSRGPVFFHQTRIGKNFVPFQVHKFRSMVAGAQRWGGQITPANDPRITRVGRVLRRLKLDELPQLLNVARGEMSFVGPRPEVAEYVEMFKADYAEILSIRPGLTDPASLEFVDEARILAAASDPEREYVSAILPRKLDLARRYVRERSLARDLRLIFATIARIA